MPLAKPHPFFASPLAANRVTKKDKTKSVAFPDFNRDENAQIDKLLIFSFD
jgi:hypothetical protein